MHSIKRLALALIAPLLVMMPAVAQESDQAQAETMTVTEVPQYDEQGYLRVGHFVPDAAEVDVYVDGEAVAQNVTFTHLSPWMVLPAGSHAVAVSETGLSAADAIFDTTINVMTDSWLTAGLVSVDDTLDISLIYQEMYTTLPGTAQVTFANLLNTQTGVNFTRDDVVFVAGVPVTTGGIEIRNSIPVDAHTFTYNVQIDAEPVLEGSEIDTVDTSSYLIIATDSPDNPQLIVDETPRWRIRLLDGTLEAPGSLLEAMEAEPLAASFLSALEAADMTDILTQDAPVTIFVPADYVMDDVDLSRDDLADILRNHIVEQNYKFADLNQDDPQLTTLNGNTLLLDGEFVNGVQIIDVNVAGSNGTIHIINDLLMP